MNAQEEAMYWIKQAKFQHDKATELIRLGHEMLKIARRIIEEEMDDAS